MKVLCKKGYNSNFIKGKFYEIIDKDDYNTIIVNGECVYMYIDSSYSFYIDGNKDKSGYSLSFYEHFYTEKEIRKLKLESIESGG